MRPIVLTTPSFAGHVEEGTGLMTWLKGKVQYVDLFSPLKLAEQFPWCQMGLEFE
jgi:hypothetical protein